MKRGQRYDIYPNLLDTNIKKPALTIDDSSHDEKIIENFWSYCKNTFEKDEVINLILIKQVAKIVLKNPCNKTT